MIKDKETTNGLAIFTSFGSKHFSGNQDERLESTYFRSKQKSVKVLPDWLQ
jgi:hypothetical protein